MTNHTSWLFWERLVFNWTSMLKCVRLTVDYYSHASETSATKGPI